MNGGKIVVTDNAIARWKARVDPTCTEDEIRRILSGPTILVAARFGARVVRFGRFRALLQHSPIGVAVLTVLRAEHGLPTQLLPPTWGGVPPIAAERLQFPTLQGDN